MNIFNILKPKAVEQPPIIKSEEVLANGKLRDQDVNDPTGKFVGIRTSSIPRSNQTTRKNVDFFNSEYDLQIVANAIHLDGILRRSTNLFKEQILKNGYEITSKNDRLLTHLTRRLKEIERLTDVPFNEVITQAVEQLVSYGNAYIIKVRSESKTALGESYRLYGKQLKPIVGLFVADATTMRVGINPDGQVVQYKQTIRGEERFWDDRDVIHLAYNKLPGTLTGTPPILSVLDDVRALRKLEEEIEILGFQYAVPLYLYKVGNKDIPAAPGEIEDAITTINNMPPYGMLVVPGHHSVEVPTNTSTPVDIMEFINYFKSRIYSGLGVAPVAMGEVSTSNRNTSEISDLTMQTITKSYQQILTNRFELDLLRELGMDGGFDNIDDDAEFKFPEIDLETQIKFETNVIQKFQNNIITRSEARLELDYERKIVEEDTFLRLVDIPKIEAQADAKAAVAASSSNAKATDSKVRPSNQYGKSTGRPRIRKDSSEFEDVVRTSSMNLLDNKGYESTLNRNKFIDKVVKEYRNEMDSYIKEIISSTILFYELPLEDAIDNDDSIKNFFDTSETILRDKLKRFSNNLDDKTKFEILHNEVLDMYEYQAKKVENLGKMILYKNLGYKTILIKQENCSQHKTVVSVPYDKLNYRTIPPFSIDCKCEVEEDSFNEFLYSKKN